MVNWEWNYNWKKEEVEKGTTGNQRKLRLSEPNKALRWKSYGEEHNKYLRWLWLRLNGALRWRKLRLRLNSEESKPNKTPRWRKLRLRLKRVWREPIEWNYRLSNYQQGKGVSEPECLRKIGFLQTMRTKLLGGTKLGEIEFEE